MKAVVARVSAESVAVSREGRLGRMHNIRLERCSLRPHSSPPEKKTHWCVCVWRVCFLFECGFWLTPLHEFEAHDPALQQLSTPLQSETEAALVSVQVHPWFHAVL